MGQTSAVGQERTHIKHFHDGPTVKERKAQQDVWKIFSFMSLLICVLLGVTIFYLSTRITKLERTVLLREEADPLIPDECPTPGVPCLTTIVQVLSSPQKYHGRNIAVTGLYVSGFETSALYDKNSEGDLNRSEAIWISDGLSPTSAGQVVTVVGLFKRGSSGHRGEYPGRLTEVRQIPDMGGH